LKNVGGVPACDAAFKVQLFDTAGQPLGQWISGLYTSHFYVYTLTDGSTTIAACASPGDVTMTEVAITAPGLAVGDVAQVVYYYAYFALDAALVDGLTVGAVDAVTTAAGTSYTGTVTNHLDTTVGSPSVAVFPLTCAGRPLGIATAGDSSQVPAGGSWSFQTNAVDAPGAGFAAFPAASF
ncbi:MAG TPA: FxLYD domain-containing protein, partial [Polyangia bacterium]|nr:FxLYD domain-containing protein [Polyangia bacterium]